MIAATIQTRDGQIELSTKTGKWEGAEPHATMANAIAQLQDATPDKGDPVLWVVNQVANVVRGKVEVPGLEKRDAIAHKGRVY
jgi:hypothetical protein